jgi:hypothetical protein
MIRNATVKDLPALLLTEEVCWDPALRASSVTILNRISDYPEGQYIVESQGEILGVLYTQRISCSVEEMVDKGFRDQASLHDPMGSIIQLLAINVPSGECSYVSIR